MFTLFALALATGCAPDNDDTASSAGSDWSAGQTGNHPGGGADAISDLEQYLVGVWKDSYDDDAFYFVLNADRTGCEWTREGDDYGWRFDELQFTDWQLDESLDEDGLMTLTFSVPASGEVRTDKYAPLDDKVLPIGEWILAMTWQDYLMDCSDSGTDAHTTDVPRGGAPYGGEETGGGDGGEPGGPSDETGGSGDPSGEPGA